MTDKELKKIIKIIISEKHNITVTDVYFVKKEYDNYWFVRYDYWTNELKFIKDKVTYVYDKDVLLATRKMKLENLGNKKN